MTSTIDDDDIFRLPAVSPGASGGDGPSAMALTLYHRSATGRAILSAGFRDGTGTYGTSSEHSGVWLSNVPLGINDGACGQDLLEVVVTESDVRRYEWLDEVVHGGYREWLAAAWLLNERAIVRLLTNDEADQALESWRAT